MRKCPKITTWYSKNLLLKFLCRFNAIFIRIPPICRNCQVYIKTHMSLRHPKDKSNKIAMRKKKKVKEFSFSDFQICYKVQFSSVQSLSPVRLFATPWIAARQASLSITNSQSSLKLMSIESVMASSHLILCHHLLLPPIPPSIRVFSNESILHMRWPKYWSFSFSIIPSKEIPGLIFRMDWLDLLAVQGALKSLLQHHHASKASILWCLAFFTVQLSHPYMTRGKTIALTRRTLLAK